MVEGTEEKEYEEEEEEEGDDNEEEEEEEEREEEEEEEEEERERTAPWQDQRIWRDPFCSGGIGHEERAENVRLGFRAAFRRELASARLRGTIAFAELVSGPRSPELMVSGIWAGPDGFVSAGRN